MWQLDNLELNNNINTNKYNSAPLAIINKGSTNKESSPIALLDCSLNNTLITGYPSSIFIYAASKIDNTTYKVENLDFLSVQFVESNNQIFTEADPSYPKDGEFIYYNSVLFVYSFKNIINIKVTGSVSG